MALKQSQVDKIYNAVVEECKTPGRNFITWPDITGIVGSTKVKVDNWMNVRGILQFMINQGQLKRTSILTIEEYEIIHDKFV